MKITAEVREFAAKQNAPVDTFVAAQPLRHGEGDYAQHGGGAAPLDASAAEAGMAEMSELYNETGRELYIKTGEREHR